MFRRCALTRLCGARQKARRPHFRPESSRRAPRGSLRVTTCRSIVASCRSGGAARCRRRRSPCASNFVHPCGISRPERTAPCALRTPSIAARSPPARRHRLTHRRRPATAIEAARSMVHEDDAQLPLASSSGSEEIARTSLETRCGVPARFAGSSIDDDGARRARGDRRARPRRRSSSISAAADGVRRARRRRARRGSARRCGDTFTGARVSIQFSLGDFRRALC
jgi:hypothetical protein